MKLNKNAIVVIKQKMGSIILSHISSCVVYIGFQLPAYYKSKINKKFFCEIASIELYVPNLCDEPK
jgi:hypothetical protein